MDTKLDFTTLFVETRARVYLVWLILVTAGFVATHFNQTQSINGVWFVISLIGLGYMYKAMPLRVKQMQNIYLAWLVPIVVGMAVSGLVFKIRGWATLIAYLGAFWLLVMAAGYAANGLVDKPAKWYYFAAVLNVLAGIACFYWQPFIINQYLVAAVVSFWSMANLWLFRT